jgi:methionine transaminase
MFESKLPKCGTSIFSVMSSLANQHQAINLAQGFPNFESSARLHDLVSKAMREGYNQYAPMPGLLALRSRIAEKIELLYGATVHPETEITVTAGGTQAIFTAINALVHVGDEVIVIEPAYDSYIPTIELCGGIPVIYELSSPDYTLDWTKLATLISPKTRMLILNTPHNPTGKVWSKFDMEQLDAITKHTDVLILSDEVYEHLTYDGLEHESVLRYPSLRERSFVVYSFGKTFHTTGWKMGYCVAPPQWTAEFRKIHQFNVFSVNSPIQHALATFLQTPEEYLGLNAFYQKKRDFLLHSLEKTSFLPLKCQGTYFQLYDYSAISTACDLEFAKRLTTDYGVAVIPVSPFFSSGKDEKIIRLCFAKTEETLSKAGELLRLL